MIDPNRLGYNLAVRDFRRARRSADLERLIAKLTGRPADLLSYEDVRTRLKAGGGTARGLQEVPLHAIVGSVGRYAEFSRSFLPRRDSDEDRWARVKARVIDMKGWPPIEVYLIGGVYFVLDGNHRVSVARQLGVPTIRANVTEVHTRVPLSPDVRPDELIIKAEYAGFLERTRLDELYPEVDWTVTAPGRYGLLEASIEAHRRFLENGERRTVSSGEAATHWYDRAYRPVAEIIRQRGVLRDFPGRTETDLYLWLCQHRAELEASLDWRIDLAEAVLDLASEHGDRPGRRVARAGKKFLDAVIPAGLGPGPPPGLWGETWALEPDGDQVLFQDLLVPLSGDRDSWRALEQALEIAGREGGQLRGLHVVANESEVNREGALVVQARFDRCCRKAGVPGHLAVRAGKVAHQVCRGARWADLVVLRLAHPPAPHPIARLGSGFRTLVRRCPRPVLAVPGEVSRFERALLAYDGSPKGNEALFVASYLTGRWNTALTVVTVVDERAAPMHRNALAWARKYLEVHGADSERIRFVEGRGRVAEVILNLAREHAADLLVMGGYGFSPLVEVVLGSAVDQVLRESSRPVLVCR